MLLNAAKCQGYSFFTVSQLLRENQQGKVKRTPPCMFYWEVSRYSGASRPFFKISVLKNFTIFTGKHLCPSLFFNKVAGLEWIESGHKWISCNF